MIVPPYCSMIAAVSRVIAINQETRSVSDSPTGQFRRSAVASARIPALVMNCRALATSLGSNG